MKAMADLYLPVLRAAQRLGLVAPCLIKGWPQWWQETHFIAGKMRIRHGEVS